MEVWIGILALLRRMKLPRKKSERSFVDGDAELEGEATSRKKALVSAGLLKLKGLFSSRKKVMIIKSGASEKVVVEIQDSRNFPEELKEWYARVRVSPKEDSGRIEEAFDLTSRASKRARSKVLEDDAMNGEFMLRMMDAYANKKTASRHRTAVSAPVMEKEAQTESSVFARAIGSVMTDKTVSDEDILSLEDVDDTDDDFIINDIGSSGTVGGDVESFVGAVALEKENEDRIAVDEDIFPGRAEFLQKGLVSAGIARHLLDLEARAHLVLSGDEQWEDDLCDSDLRRDALTELFDALEDVIVAEADVIRSLSVFDMESDRTEIEWLQRKIDVLGEVRVEMIAFIAPLVEEPGPAENDEDLDDLFSIPGSPVSSGVENEEQELEDGVAVDGGHDDPFSEVRTGFDEGDHDHDPAAPAQESEDTADIEASMEPHIPVNVSLGELEEVERSGELIYRWGYVAKGAGAAEARISHSVVVKDGLRRRVVGISHLLAKWRSKDSEDSRRLNIVLRHVPEGDWSLCKAGYCQAGIRMVDTNGDFVVVSAELIAQPEIASGVLLVHFYGPGAPPGVFVEEGNMIVTTDTLSVERVKTLMEI